MDDDELEVALVEQEEEAKQLEADEDEEAAESDGVEEEDAMQEYRDEVLADKHEESGKPEGAQTVEDIPQENTDMDKEHVDTPTEAVDEIKEDPLLPQATDSGSRDDLTSQNIEAAQKQLVKL